jgi:hypothetical protein
MRLRAVVLAGGLLFSSRSFSQAQSLPTSLQAGQTSHIISSAKERKELLDNARKSYSRLSAQGFAGFHCRVQPDFDGFYKGIKTDSVAQTQLLPILQKVTFRVVVGPDGASTVSHQSDIAPPNEAVAERVRNVIDGTEQVITGFIHSWAPLSINSPFSADEESKEDQFEDLGSKYRLTHKDKSSSVVVLVRRDYAVEEVEIVSTSLRVSMRPAWEATPKGWRLAGYEATYSSGAGPSQKVSIAIDYQDVEGLQLPRSINATIPIPAGTVIFPFAFVDPHIERR